MWYGHVSNSSGRAKTILQGTVKGGRRQGRQTKRWEDNIGEWTGLEFAKSQRAVDNRENWRKLVAKSSVVPQRPWRVRDSWWWWPLVEFSSLYSLACQVAVIGGDSCPYCCVPCYVWRLSNTIHSLPLLYLLRVCFLTCMRIDKMVTAFLQWYGKRQ